MIFARTDCGRSIRYELAAAKLLLCAKAARANHPLTPMTRASAASTEEKVDRFSFSRSTFESRADGGVSMAYVIVFLATLTALLAAALAFATHPLAAVLLALGAMTLSVHLLDEFIQKRT